jgi:hypothetical protein
MWIPRRNGKHLCPLLVHMAYDGCLQRLVEAFHESFSCGVVSNCPRELDATQLGQGEEELTFKLMSWSVVMVCSHTAEIFWQRYCIRWILWYQGLAVSHAAGW